MDKTEKVIVAGFGGQGVMMIGQMLSYAANMYQLNTLWFPSYGPETRGGTANCSVSISQGSINSPVISKATTVMALNKPSLDKFGSKVATGGKLFINSSLVKDDIIREDIDIYRIPINDLAISIGNPKVANMILLGAFCEVSKLFTLEQLDETLVSFFPKEKQNLVEINQKAFRIGSKFIRELEGKA